MRRFTVGCGKGGGGGEIYGMISYQEQVLGHVQGCGKGGGGGENYGMISYKNEQVLGHVQQRVVKYDDMSKAVVEWEGP